MHALKDYLISISYITERLFGFALVSPFIEVIEETPQRFSIRSTFGNYAFDARLKAIFSGDRKILKFEKVRYVEIGYRQLRGEAPTWSVNLYVHFFHRVRIGRTRQDVDASIAAARIASLLRCKVVSMAPSL